MKPFLFSLFVFILVTPFVLADPAGWSNDFQLTNSLSAEDISRVAINSLRQTYIVWNDDTATAYYTKVDQEGTAIIPQTRITNALSDSTYPSIGVGSNDNVHLIFVSGNVIDDKVYYKKLSSNGNVLVPETRISFTKGARYPLIDIGQNGELYVVWGEDDYRNGIYNLYFKRLNNNGNNLTGDIQLTFDNQSYGPSIDVDRSGNLHIAWHTYNGVFYKKVDSNGNTLINTIQLETPPSAFGNVVVDTNEKAHIVWVKNGLNYIKLNQLGVNETPKIQVSSFGTSGPFSIAKDNHDNIHMLFQSNFNLYYTKLDQSGNILLRDMSITSNPNTYALAPNVQTDSYGAVRLSWIDRRTGQWELYYKSSLSPKFTIQGQPVIGNTINITLSDPLNPNTSYLFLMSLSNNTGIPLGDGRKIPLDYDGLFEASLFYPQYFGLNNAQGMLDQNGNAVVTLAIPSIPALVGLNLYVGYITIYPGRPIPQLINSIADAEKIIFY